MYGRKNSFSQTIIHVFLGFFLSEILQCILAWMFNINCESASERGFNRQVYYRIKNANFMK